MTPQQFELVEQLFFQARQLPLDRRTTFLADACRGDTDVLREVRGLLDQDKGAGTGPPLAAQVLKVDPRFLIGRTIRQYQITDILGEGGMGVVYRARDTQLHRWVAMKTLPLAYSEHPERLSRFMREARLVASLSHPNIATTYGLEEHDGSRFLVMELVDGQGLQQRLTKGPLSIEEALRVCREIAVGVEVAHEAGVIHRDLKPGNVMFCADGTVKVLDFGLAREVDPDSPDGQLTRFHGSSVTSPQLPIGTPGYMSPEQVRGRELDRRTDVFALGCILFECLTGRMAFEGPTGAEMAANVLQNEPDWSLLPTRTPASVVRLLRRCLAKDKDRRLRDMGDIRLEIDEALDAREWLTAPVARPIGHGWWKALAYAASAVAVAAVVALVAATMSDGPRVPPPPVRQFAVGFPGDATQTDLAHTRVALSRDGGHLVVSASDGHQTGLFVRDNRRGGFTRLAGTDDAWIPGVSPDGRWVVYFDHGVMRKVPLAGGNPVNVHDIAGYWGGYAWGADGMISFVPYWGRGVARVHHDGGALTFATDPDAANGEFAHLTPHPLPDGRTILYGVWDGQSKTRIDAVDLATGRAHVVVEHGSTPRVAATPYGPHLLWERAGTLYAAPFDPGTARRTGPVEAVVADRVLSDRVLFTACYDVADDGTLAYVPGPAFVEESRLSWLDVRGVPPPAAGSPPAPVVPRPIDARRAAFVEPNFARTDGTKLSVILKDDVFRPYLYDLSGGGKFDRVVVDGDVESAAISPDGTRLAYCSNKGDAGTYDVYVRDLPTGREQMVFEGQVEYPSSITWAPDGSAIAFSVIRDPAAPRDIVVVTLTPTVEVTDFCTGGHGERVPRWSPDGRWLAYVSDESGRREVYLKSYPDGTLARQISYTGGDWPAWAPDGGRLYYRARGGLYAVPMAPDGTTAGDPALVYPGRFGQSDFDMSDYTVHPDGRLLIVEPSESGPTAREINVVLNWYNLPSVRGLHEND